MSPEERLILNTHRRRSSLQIVTLPRDEFNKLFKVCVDQGSMNNIITRDTKLADEGFENLALMVVSE